MRLLLRLLVLLAAAIGLAVATRYNPGNVVFFYPPYRIDLSLNFFLLLAIVLYLVLYLTMNAIRSTQNMPERVAAYRREKRERETNRALQDALKSLFEGRFGHAEKAAMRAAESPDNVGLSALIAARAAHKMQQPERRDAWLSRISNDNDYKMAGLMTTIELMVDDHQPASALEAVAELNASGTRHIHVLRWALKANQQAKNWPEVVRLVRLLEKRNALHPALSQRLKELAYEDILSDRSHDTESIRREWQDIPPDDRVTIFVAAHAARAFNARGLQDDARIIIEKALAIEWDEQLIRVYRDSAATEGSPALLAQIEHCEEWMQQRPTDAELALTLGTLCLRQKLWGKAQRYLEQALSDAVLPQTLQVVHLTLAQLHEALSHPEEAALHYRLCALATTL
jgi:HemY protein